MLSDSPSMSSDYLLSEKVARRGKIGRELQKNQQHFGKGMEGVALEGNGKQGGGFRLTDKELQNLQRQK